ncbi:hypothetical protein D9M69_218720 [compost metagenome]
MIRKTLLLSLATLLASPVAPLKAASLNWYSAAELYCSHIPRERPGPSAKGKRAARKYKRRRVRNDRT